MAARLPQVRGADVKIPSPRTFIEITALILFGICTAIGTVIVVVLLVGVAAIEKAYDGARAWRKGRRW